MIFVELQWEDQSSLRIYGQYNIVKVFKEGCWSHWWWLCHLQWHKRPCGQLKFWLILGWYTYPWMVEKQAHSMSTHARTSALILNLEPPLNGLDLFGLQSPAQVWWISTERKSLLVILTNHLFSAVYERDTMVELTNVFQQMLLINQQLIMYENNILSDRQKSWWANGPMERFISTWTMIRQCFTHMNLSYWEANASFFEWY